MIGAVVLVLPLLWLKRAASTSGGTAGAILPELPKGSRDRKSDESR